MMPMDVYPPLTMPQLVSYLPNIGFYGSGNSGSSIVISPSVPQPIAANAPQPLAGSVLPYIGRYGEWQRKWHLENM